MRKYIELCDICDMDGDEEVAIGEYTADDKEDYFVCEKHLDEVKEAKLSFKLLERS